MSARVDYITLLTRAVHLPNRSRSKEIDDEINPVKPKLGPSNLVKYD